MRLNGCEVAALEKSRSIIWGGWGEDVDRETGCPRFRQYSG